MLNSILWKLSRSKSGTAKWLRDQASVYLDYYNDFGYDFATNGERFVIERLKAFTPTIVLDVGANVGDWSKMAAQSFPKAVVHAFELSESTRDTLRHNLSTPRFIVSETALGAKEESLTYKDYGDLSTVNTMTSSSYHDPDKKYTLRSAQVTTGDAYVKARGIDRIDLLKIDVEGAEFAVLKGFEDSLKSQRIRVIQFEYGYANGDAGNLMKDFYALLGDFGYEIGKMWSAGVRFAEFAYPMNNFDSGPNYLAVAKSETEVIKVLRSKA